MESESRVKRVVLTAGEMLHTMLVQQLRRLDDCWVSESTVPVVKDDGLTTRLEQRIKQRRLWWTVFLADSFWAAGTSSEPVVWVTSLVVADSQLR